MRIIIFGIVFEEDNLTFLPDHFQTYIKNPVFSFMKKTAYLSILFFGFIFAFSACKKDEPKTVNPVTQFVYDGLSTYYLWADEMKSKEPTAGDVDPKTYFKSVLNSTDTDQGWSFITDDVESLLASFSGEPVDFGFALGFAYANEAKTEFYAVIKYVFPNSPAYNAGLRRNDLIGKINGQPITESNYRILYGNSTATFTTYKNSGSGYVADKDITMTPVTIQTNPVLYTNIYEIGGKKIAYLFYTDFIKNYNSSLFNAFSQFKQAGVTDLVLDLRYNHGGSVVAAIYLSSLIAPEANVRNKAPFIVMSYNSFINGIFDKNKWSRTDSLGVYSSPDPNPLNANLNLSKVYIIATDDSYSASELTTFCLKPYMEVVHIGGNTGGKYTASWTLHPYKDEINGYSVMPVYEGEKLNAKEKETFKNWGMQPIVAKYTNYKNEDFSNPGYLAPAYALREGNGYIANRTQIGDTKDTYLGQAIYLITGDAAYKPAQIIPMNRIKASESATIKLSDPTDLAKEAVILDDPNRLGQIFRK